MKFLIPSYRRSNDISTVKMLLEYGVCAEEIYVGVQTLSDYKDYKGKVNGANIVYGKAKNPSGNRNNLMTVLKDGEQAVFMDDDLTKISEIQWKDINKIRKKRTDTRIIF